MFAVIFEVGWEEKGEWNRFGALSMGFSIACVEGMGLVADIDCVEAIGNS